MGKRAKIGDIIEIETKIGFFYAQYTHKDSTYGALLQIFDKNYETHLIEFPDLIQQNVRFSQFFPLNAALKKNIFTVVSNEKIREDLKPLPLFRLGVRNPATKKVDVWWLWDGEKEWKIGDLDENQKKLSGLGVCNDTFLVNRLESGWRPETDPAIK